MQSKRLIVFALVLAVAVGSLYGWYSLRARGRKGWDAGAIRASYVSTQLRETDPEHASLVLTYELTNNTDQDSRLADGANFVVMSRLKSDRSLSSQEDIRVSYPTFLPAHQSARVALEIRHSLVWPEDNDAQLQNKLKDFVNQRLDDVAEFVLFDQADHFQIEFPGGWRELKLASATGVSGN